MAERGVEYYKQKTWCDAKDGLGVWRLARVKKRQKNKVLVNFDGWSDRWKQWHCLHSTMLAPLRMYSKGYTGQSCVALREWDFNDEYLKIVEGKIKILLHNNFEGYSPYDLAVLLRGDLFVLVDSLLTYTYNNPSKDYTRVMDFFALFMELFLRWMQSAPAAYEEQRAVETHADAYLQNNAAAVYRARFELIETFTSVTGSNPRTNRFYERKELGASPDPLLLTFARKNGVQAATALVTSSIPLQDIWKLLLSFPKVLVGAKRVVEKKIVAEFCEGLWRKLETVRPDAMLGFTQEERLCFCNRFDEVISLVGPSDRSNFLRARLQVEVASPIALSPIPSQDFRPVKPEPEDERRAERRPEFLQDSEGALEDPFDQGSMIEHDEEPNNEAFGKLREYVDMKAKGCMEAVAQLAAAERPPGLDQRLETIFKEHSSCDQQEFAVLNTIETLMDDNDLVQALRLIRWRKKVLKVAALSGWETARMVARRTVQSLEVTARDLIEENLRAWSFLASQSLSPKEL